MTEIKKNENNSERLLARYYAEYRKIDKIEDKEVCKVLAIEKLENQGLKYTDNLNKVFANLDKLIDGDCNCQNINDAECVELIQDKIATVGEVREWKGGKYTFFQKDELDKIKLKPKFYPQDAEKVKEEFNLEFPIEDILEGLNIELEHKDITGGDLEETAKIVIAHLKERKDYYKKLKKYVETKDGSFLINDAVSFHNKKATIMRDGYYKYLAKEVDNKAFYPMDIVKVYRPAEEVKKAYDRFMELKRIPAIANHPEQDLDLSNNDSFKDGEGINPKLKVVNGEMLLDCDLNLTGKTKEFYDKGIKEISCGWHGIYEKVEDESKDYQYIQRFKDFNHIAILERGRCGGTCSIKDNQIKDEVLEMEITKEELLKMVNDKVAEILDAKLLEGKETKQEEKLESKNPENEEDIEDAYFESEEDEEDIDKAKGKLKRLKDCYKKMKDKNKTVKDEAINDFEVEKQKIKDEMIKENNGIFEVIEKGIFTVKEVNDKLPCEIKAMTIKKVLDKEISVNDVAMETLFEVALKNFKNPIWDNKSKISINDIETIRRNSKKELEEIAIVK